MFEKLVTSIACARLGSDGFSSSLQSLVTVRSTEQSGLHSVCPSLGLQVTEGKYLAEQWWDAVGHSLNHRQREAHGVFASHLPGAAVAHIKHEITALLWLGTPLQGSKEGASQPMSVTLVTHEVLPNPEHR